MLGVGAWRKELVPMEHIFSFRFRPYFGEPLLSMEANRATLELLPCRKMAEEHGGVSIHFEWITHSCACMHTHTHTHTFSTRAMFFLPFQWESALEERNLLLGSREQIPFSRIQPRLGGPLFI